jgi:hypothetical protein
MFNSYIIRNMLLRNFKINGRVKISSIILEVILEFNIFLYDEETYRIMFNIWILTHNKKFKNIKISKRFIIKQDIIKHIWSDKEIDEADKILVFERYPQLNEVVQCIAVCQYSCR